MREREGQHRFKEQARCLIEAWFFEMSEADLPLIKVSLRSWKLGVRGGGKERERESQAFSPAEGSEKLSCALLSENTLYVTSTFSPDFFFRSQAF